MTGISVESEVRPTGDGRLPLVPHDSSSRAGRGRRSWSGRSWEIFENEERSGWMFGVVTGRDAIVRMEKGNGVFDRIREDEREFRINGRIVTGGES